MLFVQKHLKLLLALLSFVGFFLLGLLINKRGSKVIESPSIPDLKTEFRAISAEASAQKAVNDLGAEKARELVLDEHAARLRVLDVDQKKQADELHDDPAKLAAFLVRAGRSL